MNEQAIGDNESGSAFGVPEDESRVFSLRRGNAFGDVDAIVQALRRDQVVVVSDVRPEHADKLIAAVAERFGLRDALDVQAAFASVHGHRTNVGRHFMSVNQRKDYQFIPSHSEGQYKANIQIASLYCYENSTDGGESVLMHTDSSSPMWQILRSVVRKVDLGGKELSPADIAHARMVYQINIPEDLLGPDDVVVREYAGPIPGVKLFDVLKEPEKSYSRILESEVQAYWDNIASMDFDSGAEYLRLLSSCGLLRTPAAGLGIEHLDNAYERRVWRSGVRYESLFNAKVTRKLAPRDLVIQNNLTWTHSTANWTPGSGNRKVAVAFA